MYYARKKNLHALQEISCKEIGTVMYIRSVLNGKAFHLFTALFFSTSEVSVCKARTRTISAELLPSLWKTYTQSFFLSLSFLYLSTCQMAKLRLPLVLQSFCLENKVLVLFRTMNIMKCQYSSGVLFYLLNEMP